VTTRLVDRYELGRELGRGGMAKVVAAHDLETGYPVAVKLLTAVADPVARARFLREARNAARIRHPAAVAVYESGEADGQPYIVMELLRGRTLGEQLRRVGPLTVPDAVRVTRRVLAALGVAHDVGVVHRDITPANVFLLDEGGVKLGDFGIAKALDDSSSHLTATGAVMGTPTYLAPELIGGGGASPASDLYGVGCLLYAELAGRPPFHEGGPVAVAYAHRHQPIPPVARHRPELPQELVDVVDRALAKVPDERFPDAPAMKTALEAVPRIDPAADRGSPIVVPSTSPADAPRSPAEPAAGPLAAERPGRPRATEAEVPANPPRTTTEEPSGETNATRASVASRVPWTLLLVLIVLAATWYLTGMPGLDALRTVDPTG
jgi:eukaryotic-like serine/threonine-protein kinase